MAASALAITFLVYLLGTSLIVVIESSNSPIPALITSVILSILVFTLLFACAARVDTGRGLAGCCNRRRRRAHERDSNRHSHHVRQPVWN